MANGREIIARERCFLFLCSQFPNRNTHHLMYEKMEYQRRSAALLAVSGKASTLQLFVILCTSSLMNVDVDNDLSINSRSGRRKKLNQDCISGVVCLPSGAILSYSLSRQRIAVLFVRLYLPGRKTINSTTRL